MPIVERSRAGACARSTPSSNVIDAVVDLDVVEREARRRLGRPGDERGRSGPARCSGRRGRASSETAGRTSLSASSTGARCQIDAADRSATSSSNAKSGAAPLVSAIASLRTSGAARTDRTRPTRRSSCDRAPRSAAIRAARGRSAEPRATRARSARRTTPTATANRTSQRRGGTSLNSAEDSADMENAGSGRTPSTPALRTSILDPRHRVRKPLM